MATDADFMRYVTEQLRGVTGVTVRKMFGEYAVYVNARVVALVCDNRLFVKPTKGGRALLDPVVEAAPYPGAKPYFALDDVLDDSGALARVFSATAAELAAAPEGKRTLAKKRQGN